MRRSLVRIFALCAALAAMTGHAPGQPPDPGTYSDADHEVRESRGHRVPMRDGVRLSVDLYRPEEPGRYPAILVHIPYGNNVTSWTARARWFARRGYAVALSDTRGRYDSEGDWDPFDHRHKLDGHDLVEWAAGQPWCDGKVGMMGRSYMGWTQWWTATQVPPSLRTIVPEVAPPDQMFNAPYQDGILVGWAMDWAAMLAGRTNQVVGEGPYGGFATTRVRDLMRTPYIKLDEQRGAFDSPWFATWVRENLATADYWRRIAYQTREDYARVAVPSLNVTGWFDANFPGAPRNYRGMKQYGATAEARRPRLVIGPWPHGFNEARTLAGVDYGPEAVIDWDGYVCRWFDRYLKGRDNGVERDPPVFVFVMGRNRWRAEEDWPLRRTRWTKYYLHGRGRANTLHGDGVLDTTEPGDEPPDTYTYDPGHPTRSPFTGGHIDGAVDTRASAGGEEVLVYSTPPLEEEVEVTGPIEATLFASTTARDTDWMVRLVDVRPDGSTMLLCDGVLRARCRDPERRGAFTADSLSVIEPGRVYEYTIAFWRATSNVFSRGHRIRLEVSSSYFPYYLRNLNTGADNVGLETGSVVALQTIRHDARHPSHVVLPVIPTGE